MTLTERTAYIKGLCEGLGLDKKDTAEAKVITALLELCEEMALEIDDIEADIGELADYCEELDEDLGDVEEVLVDMDDCDCDCDCDEDWDDEDECDGDCDCCDLDCDCEELDDIEYFEVECPSCGETVYFDDSLDTDSLVCPACGEKVMDFELCDGDCDGNCAGCKAEE